MARYFDKKQISYKLLKNIEELTELNDIDIIIKSPGIPIDTPLLLKAKEENKLVISDLELFYILFPNAIILSITGTNGKTTTSLMIEALLKTKYKVHLGGNIGIPLFDLDSTNNFKNEIVIIECSSYMLAYTYSFHPHVAVISNIYPNHLDHHKTFKNYIESKFKMIKNMTKNDFLIYSTELNIYDELSNFKGHKICIDTISNNFIETKLKEKFKDFHNQCNFKMAVACSKLFEIDDESVMNVINNFELPKYRLEKIFTTEKLTIYNDSKSTNFLSLIKALDFLKISEYKIYWIGGGLDRLEDWEQIKEELKVIDKAYLYGSNRFKIANVLEQLNIEYQVRKTLTEIINILPKELKYKTCILFSPASPSTDQFHNYIERGEVFDKYILNHFEIGKI